MSESNAIIRIENLEKSFITKKNTVTALRDINLTIREGEIFGIIGMSGAGKSTLVRCINYLERPTKGKVFFNGLDMSKLSRRELEKTRQSIGMIFQQFNLLMQRTTIGNICFPLEIAGVPKEEARKRAYELLELVGLKEKDKAYPSELSGGQKQRVAIARALANNPKVLLCDEATSALDPKTTRSILALLKDINARMGITIVVITHEMRVIEEICTSVAIIDDSRIAETGRVDSIFTRPQTAAARKLVFPDGENQAKYIGSRCCRIVFEGNSSFEPVVANMILACHAPVNIMFADTKDIDGKAFGQIVVQLPEDTLTANKMIAYLQEQGLTAEEVQL